MIRYFSAHATLLEKLKHPPYEDKVRIVRADPDGANHYMVSAQFAGDDGRGAAHIEVVLRGDEIVIKPWRALLDD